MRKRIYAGMTLAALFSGQALANEKLTLVLDWYINPHPFQPLNHAVKHF